MLPQELVHWFVQNARDLPWRRHRGAWPVLVSEIMLQQTQVSTVLAYFSRWMKRFPTPHDLAIASESEVLKMWEGLGYYRRARALQQAAVFITSQGGFTQNEQDLLKIPGVGPYTAAAVAAFAFKQRSAPVDGNVARVMARYLCFEGDISKVSSLKILRKATLELLPLNEPWVAAEALIELGSQICRPKQPHCLKCPLQNTCQAYQLQRVNQLPIKASKTSSTTLHRSVAVINSQSLWLVRQKLSAGVFQGLWQFPYRELGEALVDISLECENYQKQMGVNLIFRKPFKKVTHGFTRYQAHLWPVHLESHKPFDLQSDREWHYQWVDINQLQSLTFCSGHRTLATYLAQTEQPAKTL